METKKIIVKGKVQGVFFRQSTMREAILHGIKGSVKNLKDGRTVEIIATGRSETLLEFINWCKHGPPGAIVSYIEVLDLPLTLFDDFLIINVS